MHACIAQHYDHLSGHMWMLCFTITDFELMFDAYKPHDR